MTTYQYDSLQNDQIRLMTLHADCNISLSRHDISRLPSYRALSYAWGPISDPASIPIAGKHINVTRNLEDALKYLDPDVYWIDAICIDQQNIDERNAQVAMMSGIYQGADVLVWVGSEPTAALNTIEHISKHVDYDWVSLTSSGDVRWWDETLPGVLSEIQMSELARFLERSWFSRLWVRQEVWNASNVVLKCRDIELPWNDVRTAFAFLWFMRGDQPTPVWSHALMQAAHDLCDDPPTTLGLALDAGRCALCSNDRDRIYALLSTLGSYPDLAQHFVVDYRRSVPEVYIDAFEAIYASEGSLSLLEKARKPEYPGLPSWTPNWTSKRIDYGFMTVCAGLRVPNPPFRRSDEVASVRGKIVTTLDRVVCIGERHDLYDSDDRASIDQDDFNFLIRLRKVVAQFSQVREQLCRVLFHNDFAERGPSTGNLAAESPTSARAVELLELALADKKGLVLKEDRSCRQMISRMRDKCEDRSLAETSTNSLALVPDEAQTGDVVAVVIDCSAPLLLRRQDSQYQCIGSVYCDGIMAGEALLGPLPTGYDFVRESLGETEYRGFRSSDGEFQLHDPRVNQDRIERYPAEGCPMYDLAEVEELARLQWINLT